MDYETGLANIKELSNCYSQSESESDRNEATTRLQFIDKLLFKCLAWSKPDCTSEERYDGKYSDYTLSLTSRAVIVEAKREGKYFELEAGKHRDTYKIATLCHDNEELCEAVKQVAGYCQKRGVPVGVVCNGHQLVALLANRNDGVPPMEGRALVFDSLEEMKSRFQQLWNCLSKEGIKERGLIRLLRGSDQDQPPIPLSSKISGYPGSKNRNSFQSNLKILSEMCLEEIPKDPENEEDFLKSCYCKSGALSQYAMVSKKLLKTRYEKLIDPKDEDYLTGDSPNPTLESAVNKGGTNKILKHGVVHRPILLIGDVGVGKTSFIRNLIQVEAKDVFDDAVSIHINLGKEATLTDNLESYVLNSIIDQLMDEYDIDIYKNNFVKGVYHGELQRLRTGIYEYYYENDKDKYRDKEIEKLEELTNKKSSHVKKSIEHIVKGQNKNVIIFIDNADQRDYSTQEKTFLIAHEISSNWPSTVFVSLRPETYHKSVKSGVLSGYHPITFTISPPRVDEVLEKRLNFALRIATGELSYQRNNSSGERSAKAEFHSIEALFRSFLGTIRDGEDLIEAIDNISGGNVRKALDFVRQFFGSGHVNAQKIVDIYRDNGMYWVPVHEFLRAIIFQDSRYYDPSTSPVGNLFDIQNSDPKGHFLKPILLRIVLAQSRRTEPGGFYDTERLFDELQDLSYSPSQIYSSLTHCYEKNLLVTSGRSFPEEKKTQHQLPESVRISTVGAYHSQRLIKNFTYIDAIIISTPILDSTYRESIRAVDEKHICTRIKRAKKFIDYLSSCWSQSNINTLYFDWSDECNKLNKSINKISSDVGC